MLALAAPTGVASADIARAPATVDAAAVSRVVPTALPPKSVRHKNSEFWTWFAPRDWESVDSKQGITVSSGNGLLNLDYGFSSTICTTGQTISESVNTYFAQQRAQLQQSLQSTWRRSAIAASRIVQKPAGTYGPLYFRQSYQVSGVAAGVRFRGEIQMDYSLATGPTYCFVRNEARTAPAAGFRTSIRQLRSVQNALAYFGPGATDEEGYTDPVR